MPPLLSGKALASRHVFQQNQISFIENETSLPRAPLLGELARQRLRGWTKDAFRVSGITQVLLCTTSPSSSLRSMPPPLVGEALAFRRVFQQNQISFIENETSLPKPLTLGEVSAEQTERARMLTKSKKHSDTSPVCQRHRIAVLSCFILPGLPSQALARQLSQRESPWQRGQALVYASMPWSAGG